MRQALKGPVFAVVFLVLTACSPKIYPTQTDSVRVEYRDRIVTVVDTVTFEVPVISEKVVTRDTTSHLENEWASSDATVSEGLLYHSLQTRPHVVEIPVETLVEVHDTLVVKEKAETIVKEVERQPTRRESFLIVCGEIFLVMAVFALLGLLVKAYLKRR